MGLAVTHRIGVASAMGRLASVVAITVMSFESRGLGHPLSWDHTSGQRGQPGWLRSAATIVRAIGLADHTRRRDIARADRRASRPGARPTHMKRPPRGSRERVGRCRHRVSYAVHSPFCFATTGPTGPGCPSGSTSIPTYQNVIALQLARDGDLLHALWLRAHSQNA